MERTHNFADPQTIHIVKAKQVFKIMEDKLLLASRLRRTDDTLFWLASFSASFFSKCRILTLCGWQHHPPENPSAAC